MITAKQFKTIADWRQRWVVLEAIRYALGLLLTPRTRASGIEMFERGVKQAALSELPGATMAAEGQGGGRHERTGTAQLRGTETKNAVGTGEGA